MEVIFRIFVAYIIYKDVIPKVVIMPFAEFSAYVSLHTVLLSSTSGIITDVYSFFLKLCYFTVWL